jgi:serine protease
MIFRFAHPTLRKSAVNHFHFFYRWSQLSHNFNILKPLKAIELSYFQEKSTITFKMVRFIFNSLTLSLFLMKAAIANIIDHGKPPLGIGALGAESQEPEQRFIVTYKHGMRDSLIKDYETMSSKSNRKKLLHDFRDLESVVVTGGEDVRKGLQANPSVATVEIDEPRFSLSQQVRTNTVPRELQLDSQVIPDGVLAVQAPQVWERGFRGAGVKICIIDSGIDATHEDFDIDHLDGTSITGMWFEDATGHGTFVAGIIAARDNDRGIVGVAPESDLHVVQIGDPAGGGFTFVSDLLASLQACVDADAKIINISLGG